MFKHILVPSDGSASSELAIQAIMRFALGAAARVSGVHVVQPFHVVNLKDDGLSTTLEQYELEAARRAHACLLSIEQYAREYSVACETQVIKADLVHAAIIQAATDRQCDLIAMASRGRKGVNALTLGSATHHVLTQSRLPVLVYC